MHPICKQTLIASFTNSELQRHGTDVEALPATPNVRKSSTSSRLTKRFRPVLRQQPVEFFDPQPFRRALGEPLQTAFGP